MVARRVGASINVVDIAAVIRGRVTVMNNSIVKGSTVPEPNGIIDVSPIVVEKCKR